MTKTKTKLSAAAVIEAGASDPKRERAGHEGGTAERSPVTDRRNETPTQPESVTAAAIGEDMAGNIAPFHLAPGAGRRPSLLASASKEMAETAQMKVTVMQEAAQLLAEAKDLYAAGADKASDAAKAANLAALKLVQARAANAITNADLSAKLGDIFGYKVKGGKDDAAVPANHPDASKTPHGQGEVIRKRIVRAVQAIAFIDGTASEGEAKFFEGLSPDSTDKDDRFTLDDVVTRMREGKIPLFTAYDYMAAIKAAGRTRVNSAFDPKAIAKIVAGLQADGAVEQYRNAPDLIAAYVQLVAALQVVDDAASVMDSDEYAATAKQSEAA